jgi:hypothetical protein
MDAMDARDFRVGERIQPKSELGLGRSCKLMNVFKRISERDAF